MSFTQREQMKNRSMYYNQDSGVALKLFPYVSSVLVMLFLAKIWNACNDIIKECYMGYRAGTSIHCGLIEGLTHGEGDMGGADAGGCFDGQTLILLGDFHCRAGGCCRCNLPQEHIHTCSHTNRTNI